MMTSHCSHSWYTTAAVRVSKCKRRTSGKLVMKTLRASYAAANGWPADLRTIVEPDPDKGICRALCRSEGGNQLQLVVLDKGVKIFAAEVERLEGGVHGVHGASRRGALHMFAVRPLPMAWAPPLPCRAPLASAA